MKSMMTIKQAVNSANEVTMYRVGIRCIDLILQYAQHPAEMMMAMNNRLMQDGMSFDTYETPTFHYVDLIYRDLEEAKHFFLRDLDFLAIQLYRNGDLDVPLDVFEMVGEFDDGEVPITNL